jgi:hypothetical protein
MTFELKIWGCADQDHMHQLLFLIWKEVRPHRQGCKADNFTVSAKRRTSKAVVGPRPIYRPIFTARTQKSTSDQNTSSP